MIKSTCIRSTWGQYIVKLARLRTIYTYRLDSSLYGGWGKWWC
jgi:hypothetical protein